MISLRAIVQRNDSNLGVEQRKNVLFLANGQSLLFGAIPTIPWHDGGTRLRETVCKSSVNHVLRFDGLYGGCRESANLLRDIQSV